MKKQMLFYCGVVLLWLLQACSTSPSVSTISSVVAMQQSSLNIGDREVMVFAWQPAQPQGVILFSHGAASAPWKYQNLIQVWVAQGYAVYAALHVDSTDHPQTEQYQGLASWQARLEDIRLLADNYGQSGYIAAGHSYGALLALVTGGAKGLQPPGYEKSLSDSRARLVLAFSPPAAIPGFIEKSGYAELSVPALIQTGTKDVPPGSEADWRGHLDAYDAAASGGDRYALVIDEVDHYFGGAIGRPELDTNKQLDELEAAADVSLLIIKAFYQQDMAAKTALQTLSATAGSVQLQSK